jgi:hypothetical protein
MKEDVAIPLREGGPILSAPTAPFPMCLVGRCLSQDCNRLPRDVGEKGTGAAMAIVYFWANLWRAARHFAPALSADSPGIDASTLEQALQGTSTWLTPRSVDGFDPGDFAFLEPAQQQALNHAVERFRTEASQVPTKNPPSPQQAKEAAAAFLEIVKLLQPNRFHDAETFRIQTLVERELQGKLPPWIESITCKTGIDVSDDPALWVWLNVSQDATAKKLITKEGRGIQEEVVAAIRRLGIPRWPYVRFQSLYELTEIPKGGRK